MRKKYRIFWTVLIAFAVIFSVVQYGPVIGKKVGKEYPFSLPMAILAIETTDARLVPLTSDARKLIGRRGPTERELTAFLAERGWKYKETMGAQIIYEKDGVTLFVHSRFRRGYWWYDLDKTP